MKYLMILVYISWICLVIFGFLSCTKDINPVQKSTIYVQIDVISSNGNVESSNFKAVPIK